jgi:hypothetical protein
MAAYAEVAGGAYGLLKGQQSPDGALGAQCIRTNNNTD